MTFLTVPGIRFLSAFELDSCSDLSMVAKQLPEGVAICSPKLVAGREHIVGVLNQAEAAWTQNIHLARNRSIELLMRNTCRNQISDAVVLSGLSKSKDIAMFGLVNDRDDADKARKIIEVNTGPLNRNDDLLLLNKTKTLFLKRLHRLPSSFDNSQLLTALREKSVLLVFAK